MTVALIDCRVCTEEVKVSGTIYVPSKDALCPVQDKGYGSIVVGAVLVFPVHKLQHSLYLSRATHATCSLAVGIHRGPMYVCNILDKARHA